ncbi:COX6A, subunit VIa of cytochrome c oxidase [Serpula lacrymans var. lacrymans S7.3]|uniref:COX6A, subunit VIa of cytochrome c oxidase n=2 Tax=Serpula lacrymans var. lacrymans TaxID=341189 RepID=F8PIH3_SERL3|nr:subunit VIa of cytochrome c oxidase, COX6A [Serpula lacrymans var. lacrymans S7.9]EGO05216.1 COX6A, subunit VIa of cytochrome c oxidase [Serpula lacrymans var. lacrymans S7.3]EGO30955.1 subunit VIa of cytochrome c oxidase, COX6A [Serpula lacrymans var. lacrymans S7.9]
MSMLARSAARSVARSAPRGSRTVVVDASATDYVAKRNAVKAHAQDTTNLWRRISFFVCVPGTLVTLAWVRNAEAEHAEHQEHLKHENGGELPEIPGYDYMNRRVKPFPWGMNSLFFNPHVNKDMAN